MAVPERKGRLHGEMGEVVLCGGCGDSPEPVPVSGGGGHWFRLGAVQEGDSLYFVQARDRKRFCIFALLRENTIFPDTYQLEYRRFGLDTMETEPLEKAEYMAVRERHSLWQI